jgi:hypothetical protein
VHLTSKLAERNDLNQLCKTAFHTHIQPFAYLHSWHFKRQWLGESEIFGLRNCVRLILTFEPWAKNLTVTKQNKLQATNEMQVWEMFSADNTWVIRRGNEQGSWFNCRKHLSSANNAKNICIMKKAYTWLYKKISFNYWHHYGKIIWVLTCRKVFLRVNCI